jgi:hypothetical protein
MKLEELKKRGFFELYHDEIEFNFLCMYYFNTLYIFLTRFIHVPFDVVSKMQFKTKQIFPEYNKNPYLDVFLTDLYKSLLRTIETPLAQEDWDNLAAVYRQYENVEVEEESSTKTPGI